MIAKHWNGETRTCPYCGQKSTFNQRVPVPDAGVGVVRSGGQPPDEPYRPGWECENRKCSRRYDFL